VRRSSRAWHEGVRPWGLHEEPGVPEKEGNSGGVGEFRELAGSQSAAPAPGAGGRPLFPSSPLPPACVSTPPLPLPAPGTAAQARSKPACAQLPLQPSSCSLRGDPGRQVSSALPHARPDPARPSLGLQRGSALPPAPAPRSPRPGCAPASGSGRWGSRGSRRRDSTSHVAPQHFRVDRPGSGRQRTRSPTSL
jgi:hypothetical protein